MGGHTNVKLNAVSIRCICSPRHCLHQERGPPSSGPQRAEARRTLSGLRRLQNHRPSARNHYRDARSHPALNHHALSHDRGEAERRSVRCQICGLPTRDRVHDGVGFPDESVSVPAQTCPSPVGDATNDYVPSLRKQVQDGNART